MMNIGFYFNRLYYKDITSLKQMEEKKQKDEMKEKNLEMTRFSYEEDDRVKVSQYYLKGNTSPFCLTTNYPGLFTGAGMGHEAKITGELNLGFYFDYTTGLPVIPGSTIKGVLRSAFPQWDNHKKTPSKIKNAKMRYIYSLIGGVDWDELNDVEKGIQKNRIIKIEKEIFDGEIGGENLSVYDRDIFLDAYISKATTKKPTPDCILGTDSITPHKKEGMTYSQSLLKNPNPIPFLKVLPDVQFRFEFKLKNHTKSDSDLLDQDAKEALFKQILTDLGIGAKTNVGYGQFTDTSSDNRDM